MSICPAWTSGPHYSCGLPQRFPGQVRPRPQADRQQQWQRQHCQLPSPMPKYWHKSIVDIIKYWAQGWHWNILTIFDGVLLTKQFTRPWWWLLEEMRQTLMLILVRWRLWEALPIARFIYVIATHRHNTSTNHITSIHARSLPCFLNPEQEW